MWFPVIPGEMYDWVPLEYILKVPLLVCASPSLMNALFGSFRWPDESIRSLSSPSVTNFIRPKEPVSITSTSLLPSNILSDTIPVSADPSIAGSAPVNFDAVSVDILASATVPVKFPAGRFVIFAPLPYKVSA